MNAFEDLFITGYIRHRVLPLAVSSIGEGGTISSESNEIFTLKFGDLHLFYKDSLVFDTQNAS